MKEYPLLRQPVMVRAILEGRKTQTRDPVQNKWGYSDEAWSKAVPHNGEVAEKGLGGPCYLKVPYDYALDIAGQRIWPRWEVGDRLWLKKHYFTPRGEALAVLEITGIRVERLQDITEEDAIAEGFYADTVEICWQGYREWDLRDGRKDLLHQQAIGEAPPDWMIEPHRMPDRPDLRTSARRQFWYFWDRLYEKKGLGWGTNCWAWIRDFKLLKGESAR